MTMTWVPSRDFRESAAMLDAERLRQQLRDNVTVADVLLSGDVKKLLRCPAAQLWAGYGEWFAAYVMAMIDEATSRGWVVNAGVDVITTLRERMGMSMEAFVNSAVQTVLEAMELQGPKWLGDERIHRSHRAALASGDDGLVVWPDGIIVVTGKDPDDTNEGTQDVGTRTEVIDQLRAKKYDGPVSYSKTRLLEILEVVEAGGSPDLPKRGRKPKETGDAGDGDQEGDLPR